MSDLYLFRNVLRELVRPGKLIAAVLLTALAILLACLSRANASPGQFDAYGTFHSISSTLIFGFMVTVLSVIAATGLIGQEIEAKTIPYLLTRPIPRWRILLVKFLAAVVVTTAAVWIADVALTLTLFPIGKIGSTHLWKDLLVLPVAVSVYSGFFLFLAATLPRPMLFGIAYLIVERLFGLMPGYFKFLSLLTWIHTIAPHLNIPTADASAASDVSVSLWIAWTAMGAFVAATVLISLIIFSVREYTPMEERA